MAVAGHLNTVNLPDDRTAVQGILDISQRSFTGAVKDPKRREYVFRPRRQGQRAHRRHVDDHRPARAQGRTLHLPRRHRRGALLGHARQALQPYDAEHRLLVQRPDRDRRSHRAARVPEEARAARPPHLLRALSLHQDAPRVVSRRAPRRAPPAPRARRYVAPVGRPRAPLHGDDVRGGRPALEEEQGVHQGPLPGGHHLRLAAPQGRAGRHRQGGRADQGRREDAPAHRLPLRRARRPLRRRPALHRARPTRSPWSLARAR